ncbi:MAG: MFS transporter [Candidatus Dependentiae bacterium]|nr:MFS transporter [Candidatus Dependentiae bacterium]
MFIPKWLNRNIMALGVVSLLADLCSEMATAILPTFLLSIGGSAATLGLIEGLSEASISFIKIFSGWYSDKLGKRKPFSVIGYSLTSMGVAVFVVATQWYHVLVGRLVGRFGKGIREPSRDALLVESTPPQFYGRMFGFHRAMDTVGAILGPLLALVFINLVALRCIFLIALIPGILAVITVIVFVEESPHLHSLQMPIISSIQTLPTQFKQFLIAVLIFGLGNFTHSLLIMRITQLLTPTQGLVAAGTLAIIFYTLHNVIYAACAYPIGYLADHVSKKTVLISGYGLTALTSLGFMLNTTNMIFIAALFLLAGVSMAATDATERSIAADLLPADKRGTGYGTLAIATSIGSLTSNITVGYVWTYVSPQAGFGYSALLCLLGTLLLIIIKLPTNVTPQKNMHNILT